MIKANLFLLSCTFFKLNEYGDVYVMDIYITRVSVGLLVTKALIHIKVQ